MISIMPNIWLFCNFANLVISVILVELIYNKCNKLLGRRQIKEVLFSNGSSACCTQRLNNQENSCTSRYCMKKNLDRIIELINNSKYTVSLAMYSLNCEELKTSLVRAHNRGVRVKIVTTTRAMTELSRDLQQLSLAGIEIRFPVREEDNLLHHKFCLLDAEKTDAQKLEESDLPAQGVLLTGSMNWTLSSFCSNWDNIVVTSNDDLITKYQTEYNSMWRRLRQRSSENT